MDIEQLVNSGMSLEQATALLQGSSGLTQEQVQALIAATPTGLTTYQVNAMIATAIAALPAPVSSTRIFSGTVIPDHVHTTDITFPRDKDFYVDFTAQKVYQIDVDGRWYDTTPNPPPIVLPTFISKPVLSQPNRNGPNYVTVTYEETGGSGAREWQMADGNETVGPYGAGPSPADFPLIAGSLPSGVKIRGSNSSTGETSAWSETSDPWP